MQETSTRGSASVRICDTLIITVIGIWLLGFVTAAGAATMKCRTCVVAGI